MDRNTRWHLVGGVLAALACLLTLQVGARYGIGPAIALGSVLAGIGVEVYQAVRKEGVPSIRDAAISSAAGVALGAAWTWLS